MGRVIIDITTSLDGYVTGPNDGPGNGLGDNGRILHEWAFNGTAEDQRFMEEAGQTLGGCVLGRRTFDIAEGAWGDTPPFGPGTVHVLTHRPHEPLQRGVTRFVFVTEGLEHALAQAQAEAAGKDVMLMGANVSQQCLKAGLVDEIQLHVANVLLGAGRPLFAHIGEGQIRLERLAVVATPTTTHLRYLVIR